MKKPKTLKDVWYCYNGYCDSMCVKQGTPAIKKMVKKWIKFLEVKGKLMFTDYPQGVFQAEILREIFDIKD